MFLQATSCAVAKDMGSFSHTSRDRWGAALVGMPYGWVTTKRFV